VEEEEEQVFLLKSQTYSQEEMVVLVVEVQEVQINQEVSEQLIKDSLVEHQM
jgi:hypothetical protein